jgi:MFS family permease
MRSRRLFLLVGALVLTEVMFYSVLTPLLPYYAHRLNLSKPEAGVLAAFYAFGAILFSVPAGFLVGRIGARRTVVAGVFVLAASSLAFGFLRSVAGLDAARCLQGAGGSLLWTGGLVWLVTSAPPEQRGEVVGSALGIGIAGALLGPVLGAAATVTSPELIFSLIAAVIAALGAWAVAMPSPPPGHANTLGDLVAAARRDPRMWAGLWFTALPSIVFGVLEVLAPLRLSALGAGAAAIAATFLVSAGVEATLSPVVGRLSDRHGPMRVARVGLGLAAVATACVSLPSAVFPLAVAVIAACVALGSPWVPASSLLSAGAAEFGLGQGIAFALWNLAWGAGQAVGAAGGAALAHATVDAVPYVVLAIVCLATVLAIRTPAPERATA